MTLRSGAVGLLLILVTGLMAIVSPAAARAGSLADPLPLGTFLLSPTKPTCIQGYTCKDFTVTGCSNVRADITGHLAKSFPPKGTAVKGVVVFFSGSGGHNWWNGGTGIANALIQDLRQVSGLGIVQVSWDFSWYDASPGEDAGIAHAACRPTTVVRWVYDNIYAPLNLAPAPGACGFCITGNSGGASAVAYALSHYGLDTILDGVFPTSGPTMSRLDKGCLLDYPDYNYSEWSTPQMDRPFGYFNPETDPGPCMRHDTNEIPRWLEEGVVSGANDLTHPDTRVEMIIGGADPTCAPFQAADYQAALSADLANHAKTTLVPDMAHTIQLFQSGLDAFKAALLGSL